MKILPEHRQTLGQTIQQIDTRPIWQIADGRYGMDRTRPPGEKWRVNSCPWAKEILDCWKSSAVMEVVLRAGSQTWKTAIFLLALAWSIRHRPGPKLWISADDGLAKDISDRVHPTLERCPDLRDLLLDTKLDKTTYKIRTKFCTIDISGAESSTSLEQNPYNDIFADECRQYKAGQLQKLAMRQRSYRDAKRALFSTPDEVGDEFDQRCNMGSQKEWFFPCEKCEREIPLVWSSKFSWLPEEYRMLSQMTFEKGSDDVWLECRCNHRHQDVHTTRRWILDHGIWQVMNNSTDPEKRDVTVESFHYPAMLNPTVVWKDLRKQFRNALALRNAGNIQPLKVFVCESLGEPWRHGQDIEDNEVVKASYRLDSVNITGSDWAFIEMTADVGKYDFWHVVRGWNAGAQSKLLSGGKLRYWEDLRTVAKKFGLVMDRRNEDGLAEGLCRRVFVDARYEDPQFQEVHRTCAEMGWACFVGVDKPYFEIKDEHGNKFRFLYSEVRFYGSSSGVGGDSSIQGMEFAVCTNAAQDILDDLVSGRVGKFEHPEDFSEPPMINFSAKTYAIHMRNEPKIPDIDKKTATQRWIRKRLGPQHLRDCEVMQVIGASMAEMIAALPRPIADGGTNDNQNQ